MKKKFELNSKMNYNYQPLTIKLWAVDCGLWTVDY
jgi:hypothetical protein